MKILQKSHLFSHALAAEPDRLHFAAHSHHLWPDVTRSAADRAWLDAAERADEKWGHVFGEVIESSKRNVARALGVADASQVAFSANTHDLLVRLLSALPGWNGTRPLRILSTGAEFHSFARQMRRFVESGRVEWHQVDAEPFESLDERFRAAAGSGAWDLVFASHVLFSSGFAFDQVFEILAGLPEETVCVVDGYHGFMALETEFGPFADRLYYTAGGYKYAMSGEGACFLVAPHGRELRPELTGWFAGFSSLEDEQTERVGYDAGASRFLGATLEVVPFYRFNAVWDLLDAEGLTIGDLHGHSLALQERFLDHVAAGRTGDLVLEQLVPPREIHGSHRRGCFLTFRRPDAQALHEALAAKRVITDVRGDRLRFGFGLYQTSAGVDALVERIG